MEPLQVGDPETIDGWQLVGRLWSAGSITAYMATNGLTSAELQVVRFDALQTPSSQEAFAAEVDRVAAIGRGRLPSVLGSSIGDGQAWLAMEYVPGVVLSDLVASRGPLPEAQWLVLADCLIASLAEVHAAGLVHRDVTPASVVYAGDVPRMTGLGIAQVASNAGLETGGLFTRTLMWLSPEQIEGSEATAASDLFSAGSTLSFAATGRPPWGPLGTPTAQVVDRIVRSAPDAEGASFEQLRLISALTAKGSSFRSGNLEDIRKGPSQEPQVAGPTADSGSDKTADEEEIPAEGAKIPEGEVSGFGTSVGMSGQSRARAAVPVALIAEQSPGQQGSARKLTKKNIMFAGAAAGSMLVVIGLVGFVGSRSTSDPSQDRATAPAAVSSQEASPEASPSASPSALSPVYVTQVNYEQGSIPDGSFPGSLDWEFDVCSSDRQLADSKASTRIALYEVKAGKWARVPSKAVILQPGRCKEGQVNITISAVAPTPTAAEVGQGWLECVKHRVITPETAKFAKSYIDFCVQTKADAG